MKLLVLTCAIAALLLASGPVYAEDKEEVMVEQTTESPIADMALVDPKADTMMTETVKNKDDIKTNKEGNLELPADTQPQTIADFIIHPLIALKPRLPEVETAKQSDVSSSTPAPWQLFGFNAGQGLVPSVSTLAGSVTGWLGNRIQLPGLVDTPVRESTTTSTTTTTTTTPKPDIVVRVKQRASTRKPLISINNNNNQQNLPNRRRKKPINNNHVDDSDEEDDSQEFDEEEEFNRRHPQDDEEDEDDEGSHENDEEEDDEEGDDDDDEEDDHNHDDEDEEEEEEQKPVKPQRKRRRHPKPLNHNRRRSSAGNKQRKRVNANRRQQQHQQEESAEEEPDYDEDDDVYYNKNHGSKRSQNEQNFIQRGQQSILKQIRQLTRGQTPAQVSSALRKSVKSKKKTRGQQATLIVNRNGQTIYVAPELLKISDDTNNEVSPNTNRRPISHYPQPPLTVPYRRKGQPTQYITIPWSQLGVSPPDDIVALTEGIQSKPLILNIPQSAIESMQSFSPNKKKQVITADTVPLLAEASIMDIFKPPRIPPARTPSTAKPTKKVAVSGTPVVIATKTKPGPTRIRPATIVEKAPAEDNKEEKKTSDDKKDDDEDDSEQPQLIVIGNESGETELSRQAYQQILEYFNKKRIGRQLNLDDVAVKEVPKNQEQLIPVQIVTETEVQEEPAKVEKVVAENMQMATESPVMNASNDGENMYEAKETKPEMVMESASVA